MVGEGSSCSTRSESDSSAQAADHSRVREASGAIDNLEVGGQLEPRGDRDVVKDLNPLLAVVGEQAEPAVGQLQIVVADAKTVIVAAGNDSGSPTPAL